MVLAFLVFVLMSLVTAGAYLVLSTIPGRIKARRLERRLRDVASGAVAETDATVLRQEDTGLLDSLGRLAGKTGTGTRLAKLLEQSGLRFSSGAFIVATAGAGVAGVMFLALFTPSAGAASFGLLAAAFPYLYVAHRRSARIRRFEEQFPEALDLLSRALRAGHAFQAAMGMVADELPEPVGPEFKKTFDQQNFGLPLKECLTELSERIPLLDVRFFVTAVTIQRETGGNLAEILDNLAHVVRERFKVLRQVRVHTAHGRFTGYVLLGLPPVLGLALAYLSPNHMNTLFTEPMGQTMLMGAGVMQTLGYFWIRQVIKIEV
jgi:tight adherence protein B